MESIAILRREAVPGGWKFLVEVGSATDATRHEVMLERSFAEGLTGYRFRNERDAEIFIKKSFLFLLERESKTSILAVFNIRDIVGYFPEYGYIMKTEE